MFKSEHLRTVPNVQKKIELSYFTMKAHKSVNFSSYLINNYQSHRINFDFKNAIINRPHIHFI